MAGYFARACPLPNVTPNRFTTPDSNTWWWGTRVLDLRDSGATGPQLSHFQDVWNHTKQKFAQLGIKAASGEPFLDIFRFDTGYNRYKNDSRQAPGTGSFTGQTTPDLLVQWVPTLPGAAEPHDLAYTEMLSLVTGDYVRDRFGAVVPIADPGATAVRISIKDSFGLPGPVAESLESIGHRVVTFYAGAITYQDVLTFIDNQHAVGWTDNQIKLYLLSIMGETPPMPDEPWYWEVVAHELGHALLLFLENEHGSEWLEDRVRAMFGNSSASWNDLGKPWASRLVEAAAETFKDVLLPIDAAARQSLQAWIADHQGTVAATIASLYPSGHDTSKSSEELLLPFVPRRKYDNRTNIKLARGNFDPWKATFYDAALSQTWRADRLLNIAGLTNLAAFNYYNDWDGSFNPAISGDPINWGRQVYGRGLIISKGTGGPLGGPAYLWVWNKTSAAISTSASVYGFNQAVKQYTDADAPDTITFAGCWDVAYPSLPSRAPSGLQFLISPTGPNSNRLASQMGGGFAHSDVSAGGAWSAFPLTFWQMRMVVQGSNDGVNWTTLATPELTIDSSSNANWRWAAALGDTSAYTYVRVGLVTGNLARLSVGIFGGDDRTYLPWHGFESPGWDGENELRSFAIWGYAEWEDFEAHPPRPQLAYPPWPYGGTPGSASIGPGPRGRKVLATPTKTREVRDGHRLTREDIIRGVVSG